MRKIKEFIVLNNINHYRDFLTLEDVCNVIKILFIKKKIGVFNICSGKKIKLINIVKGLNLFNKKIIIKKQNKLTTLVGSNYKIKKFHYTEVEIYSKLNLFLDKFCFLKIIKKKIKYI